MTSNRLSFPVWMMTVSLCKPPNVAGRPLTVTVCSGVRVGTRNLTWISFGAPGWASSTVATTLLAAGCAAIVKLTLPQRVGAPLILIGCPEATQARGTPLAK